MNAPTKPSERTPVRLRGMTWSHPRGFDPMLATANAWQEQTGVEIQIVDIANADLPTKIKEAAQANDLPAFASVGSIDPTWKDLTVDLSSITTGSDIDPALHKAANAVKTWPTGDLTSKYF